MHVLIFSFNCKGVETGGSAIKRECYITHILSQIFLLHFKSWFKSKLSQNFERRHPKCSPNISRSFLSPLKKDQLGIFLSSGVQGVKTAHWEKTKQWQRTSKITTSSKEAGREGDREQENMKGQRWDCSEERRKQAWISEGEQDKRERDSTQNSKKKDSPRTAFNLFMKNRTGSLRTK